MHLYYSPASPFARKCRIVIREKGLLDRVEEVRADPLNADAALLAANPTSQVPVLIDDDGTAWTDSPLICARLDALSGAPRLLPDGDARWSVLRREVIADGIMELGVKWRLESLRPEGERSASWIARWRAGVLRGLDAAEGQIGELPLDLAAIATACAVTWLDFATRTWVGVKAARGSPRSRRRSKRGQASVKPFRSEEIDKPGAIAHTNRLRGAMLQRHLQDTYEYLFDAAHRRVERRAARLRRSARASARPVSRFTPTSICRSRNRRRPITSPA